MSCLYKQKAVYWLAYSIHGKLYRQSLKTKDRATAKYLQSKKNQELTEGKYISLNALATSVLEEYARDGALRKSRNSSLEDVSRIRRFLSQANIVKLTDITEKRLTEYLNERLQAQKKISLRTANHIIMRIKTFLNYAVRRGYMTTNPIARYRNFKIPENPPRFLERSQIQRVLAESRKTDLYPAVATAIYTGMRKGEIFSLQWQDIDFTRNTITISGQATKSRKYRTIPLHPVLRSVLEPIRRQKGLCFDIINHRRIFNRILRKAKVKDRGIGWHLLRHSYASALVMKGVDLVTVSRLLGHADISTTMIYAHLSEDHVRGAVERLDF